MIRTFAIAAGVLALALPAAASAQTDLKLRQTVAYGDLNLASRAGMATMRQRLHSAATNLCLQATGNGNDLTANAAYTRCMIRAMDHAMQRLRNQTGAKLIDVEATAGDVAAR